MAYASGHKAASSSWLPTSSQRYVQTLRVGATESPYKSPLSQLSLITHGSPQSSYSSPYKPLPATGRSTLSTPLHTVLAPAAGESAAYRMKSNPSSDPVGSSQWKSATFGRASASQQRQTVPAPLILVAGKDTLVQESQRIGCGDYGSAKTGADRLVPNSVYSHGARASVYGDSGKCWWDHADERAKQPMLMDRNSCGKSYGATNVELRRGAEIAGSTMPGVPLTSRRNKVDMVGSSWQNERFMSETLGYARPIRPFSHVTIGCKSDDKLCNSDSIPNAVSLSTQVSELGIASNGANSRASDAEKVLITKYGGDVGLYNLGNTCFMSSVVQCLSSTRPLLHYIMQNGFEVDLTKAASASTDGTPAKSRKSQGALMEEFAKLIRSLWKSCGDTAVSPGEFKSQVQIYAPQFVGYSQQDAQEFLQHLLQGLHEDINQAKSNKSSTEIRDACISSGRKSYEERDEHKSDFCWKMYHACEDSKIVDLFAGQLRSTLTCISCGYASTTFEPFWDLSLPIPATYIKETAYNVSISDCLKAFVEEELLEGKEQPVCDHCNERTVCKKSLSIEQLPHILVLHLKRFSGERFRTKLTTEVNFPSFNLDLSVCCTTRSTLALYDLYAVINHTGSVYSGHYTASCKHPASGEWRRFDDHRVSPMSASLLVSPAAYVLFYEAKEEAVFRSSL